MPRDMLELPPGLPPAGIDLGTRRALSGWLLLAVGSLAVAGGLALLLALSRTPHVQDWLPWAWQDFFRKALVTHVVFAFVVWNLSMLGGLAAAARPGATPSGIGLFLALAGVMLLLVPVMSNLGEPSLNNYVPVMVHPSFYAGLLLLASGVTLPVLHLLLRPPFWGGPLTLGVGSAGAIFLLALICVGLAWFGRPVGATLVDYNEPLFWGGGHLLQIAYSVLLLTSWQILGEQAFGRPPLSPRAWKIVAALTVAAALPGPVFYGFFPADSEALRAAFTDLYWLGLPLPLGIGALATARAVFRGPRGWNSPEFLGVALSLALFVLGGAMGAFATGGDVRTPAHYHAEIGAVNLAFMGMFFALLLPLILRPVAEGRTLRPQFWLYFCGQTLFSLGMFLAGSEGVARKVAGEAQGLDSAVKVAGMGLTGLGGVIAVTGGVLFIWGALRRLLPWSSH